MRPKGSVIYQPEMHMQASCMTLCLHLTQTKLSPTHSHKRQCNLYKGPAVFSDAGVSIRIHTIAPSRFSGQSNCIVVPLPY